MRSEERKRQILEVAKAICSKKGFSGTKLDDVARASGVSRALVVQHFGSKEGLYEELIDFLFQSHPLEADPEVTDSIRRKDDFGVLYSFFLHVLHHMTEDKESSPLKLIVFSMLEKPDLYMKHYKKRTLKSLKLLEDYISERIKDGAFRDVDPRRFASFFVASMIYLILQHLTLPDTVSLDDVKETMKECITSLLDGVKSDTSYEKLVRFHGHSCVGLAIGYRAALIALKNGFKRAKDEEVLAIVENDSCSVDAIQFFLGCTFGKGNLFFRDYGKQVFTIVDRKTKRAIRIALRPGVLDFKNKTRDEIMRDILRLPDDELFKIDVFFMEEGEIPHEAEIRPSAVCSGCGEPVMESKTLRIGEKVYCIPCSSKLGIYGGAV